MSVTTIEDIDTESMFRNTGIPPVLTEHAFEMLSHPDAEVAAAETARQFNLMDHQLESAMILYRTTLFNSPKEHAVIREIARRFYPKLPPLKCAAF